METPVCFNGQIFFQHEKGLSALQYGILTALSFMIYVKIDFQFSKK